MADVQQAFIESNFFKTQLIFRNTRFEDRHSKTSKELIAYLRDLNQDELDAERDYYEAFRNTIYVNQQERKVAWEAYKTASTARLVAFDKRIQATYKVPLFTDVIPVHAFHRSSYNAKVFLETGLDQELHNKEHLEIAYSVPTVFEYKRLH